MRKAIFLDRDGVINKLVVRNGGEYSPREIEYFHIFPEVSNAINLIKSKGYLCIVVSNQPDIYRGLMKKSELEKMTNMLYDKLNLDDVFYCIHDDPDPNGCRKPDPGLILKAKKKWNINLDHSIMVGDTLRDLEAAKNAGIRFFLIKREYNKNIESKNKIKFLEDLLDYLN